MKCIFELAWVGQCENDAVENDYCEEHKDIVCVSCGKKATKQCPETGQLVCGAPLCDDCSHTTTPEGHNGGVGFNEVELPKEIKRHCKRSEQKYAPWYVTTDFLDMWKENNNIPKDQHVELTCTDEWNNKK
jgi:hypothetical protein